MTINELSTADFPWTSNHAAVKVDRNVSLQIKFALIQLLSEKPRDAVELTRAYVHRAAQERWPLIADLHNVKRRLSHMHTKNHVIEPTGDVHPSEFGRPMHVWRLNCSPDAARMIVASTS